MKILSFAVPCYNSEAYMRKCIDSLLPGGEDVEIIIVDDGSSDGRHEDQRRQVPLQGAEAQGSVVRSIRRMRDTAVRSIRVLPMPEACILKS